MSDFAHPEHSGTNGADAVLSMIRHVGGLAPQVEFERSFKLAEGRFSSDRFLLGVERPRTLAGADDTVAAACRAIGMPPELLQTLQGGLEEANHVYFGAERDGQSLTFKVYLEFRDRASRQPPHGVDRTQGRVLYVGYKWDAADPSRRAVSRYDWLPQLSPTEILQRVRILLDGDRHAGLRAIASAIAERALSRVDPEAIHYLEVREDGNPRCSFDINLYRAGYRMADLREALRAACAHFAAPADAFDALLERIGNERAGHLAAGVDRHGGDFLTVYHGGTTIDGTRLVRASFAADYAPP